MQTSISRGWIALALILGTACPAAAQSRPTAPVLAALAEKDTLPNGDFDTLGIRLGMPLTEALARLKEIGGGEIGSESKGTLRIGDNRGNAVEFFHQSSASASARQPDGQQDSVSVNFSTSINEARAMWISRSLNYASANQQGSRPQFVAALKAKYGEPSWQDNNGLELYWIWANGKLVTIAPPDARNNRYNKANPASCLSETQSLAYSLNGSPVRGCSTLIRVRLSTGSRDDLLSSADISLSDFTRYNRNLQDSNAWVDAELKKVIGSKTGAAPRL